MILLFYLLHSLFHPINLKFATDMHLHIFIFAHPHIISPPVYILPKNQYKLPQGEKFHRLRPL